MNGDQKTPLRSRWVRVLRDAYLVGSGTIVLALIVEIGWRAVVSAIGALGGKRPGLVQASPRDVPYTLHPYFQVLPPPTKDHQKGPFLAGWEVSPPDAAVYLDDRFVGTAEELGSLPSGLAVSAGKHTVTVSRPGFQDQSMDVQIEPGATQKVEISLKH